MLSVVSITWKNDAKNSPKRAVPVKESTRLRISWIFVFQGRSCWQIELSTFSLVGVHEKHMTITYFVQNFNQSVFFLLGRVLLVLVVNLPMKSACFWKLSTVLGELSTGLFVFCQYFFFVNLCQLHIYFIILQALKWETWSIVIDETDNQTTCQNPAKLFVERLLAPTSKSNSLK